MGNPGSATAFKAIFATKRLVFGVVSDMCLFNIKLEQSITCIAIVHFVHFARVRKLSCPRVLIALIEKQKQPNT